MRPGWGGGDSEVFWSVGVVEVHVAVLTIASTRLIYRAFSLSAVLDRQQDGAETGAGGKEHETWVRRRGF